MFNLLRKKQKTLELPKREEIEKQEEKHIDNETKNILEELVMFFFDKYIKKEEVNTNLEDIIKKVYLDDFLKNDQEFKKIIEDIISIEEKNLDKEILLDQLTNYHVTILKS